MGEVRYDHIDSSPDAVLNYDAVSQLGLTGSATTPAGMPAIQGLSGTQGGMSSNIGPVNANNYYNDKPTATATATWVKGNHSYKFGGEWRIDMWEDINTRGSQGVYTFSAAETALPSLGTTSVGGGTLGFPYASFFLGSVNAARTQNKQDPKISKLGLGFFAQDAWKVTRKLSRIYGNAGIMKPNGANRTIALPGFCSQVMNPSVGLLGATAYEGYGDKRCNCRFTDAYKFGYGPRVGVAYQLDAKTVIRAAFGIVYGRTGDGGYVTNTQIIGVGYGTISKSSPGFAQPAILLKDGIKFTNAEISAATFDPGIRPTTGQLDAPPLYIDRSGGRPPRIAQWNLSVQRQVMRDLVVEAAYVGNRGVWLRADSMIDWNGLTLERLKSVGIDLSNAADRSLLTSTFASNSVALAARGFRVPGRLILSFLCWAAST